MVGLCALCEKCCKIFWADYSYLMSAWQAERKFVNAVSESGKYAGVPE